MYKHTVVKTADLIPYVNNSRTHSDHQVQQIASSIKEFGFTNPVLVDEDNGLVAGHGRLQAATLLGLDEVPAIVLAGLTETQRKAYVIADNKLAENAGWDEEMLALELQTLDDLGFDLEGLGFEPAELDDILKPDIKDGEIDDDEIPEITDDPISKPGDLWILGEHRLYCGDATESASVEAVLGGELADLYLTDAPSNEDTKGGARAVCFSGVAGAEKHMKPGAVFYVWSTPADDNDIFLAITDTQLEIQQKLIWLQGGQSTGKNDYSPAHVQCFYGWKSGARHLWAGDRKQTTILSFDKPNKSALHPTMKPVELFLYQLLNNTKGKDIVLDSFTGSGTTIIACEKSDRRARCIEFDPVYCDVIIARWEEYTGQKAVHAETEKPFKRGTQKKGKAAKVQK